MDRNTFLKYSGVLGLGAAMYSIKPISESVRFNRNLFKVTNSRNMMGTLVTMTLMHPSKTKAEDAIASAFGEMERVCRLLNRFESDSAIGTLNRDGFLRQAPNEIIEVVRRSEYFHKLSGGVFDITVTPLLDLYQEHFELHGVAPSESRILETMKRVDGSAVLLDEASVRFAHEGVTITLDGIAKGYVVDCGATVLRALGIDHGLISAGGDIRAIGGKNKRNPWRVAVQKPGESNAFVDWIDLSDGAVATSGNYEIYYDSEKLYHHIISPLTGRSPIDVSSVSVKAGTVMDADALSTTVFVLGPNAGVQFIENGSMTECLILDANGKRITSTGWISA